MSAEIPAALARLDSLTRRLRAQCPWDREQDERSIVPHTVEEAYELADAAARGDDAKLLDELGDVLFQVHFLSLLLEERGAGDLAQVAEHCRQKLIRRHPHVFPPTRRRRPSRRRTPARSCATGTRSSRRAGPRAPGSSARCRRTCPAPLLRAQGAAPRGVVGLRRRDAARRARRARGAGRAARRAVRAGAEAGPTACEPARTQAFDAAGDLLFAAVNVARKLKVDPELALRASSRAFARASRTAERLAAERGEDWAALPFDAKLGLYAQARLNMENR